MHLPHHSLILGVFALHSFSTLVSASWFTVLQRDDDAQQSVEYTDDEVFKDAVLNSTNTFRRQHNATKLAWNETSAKFAASNSKECIFEHSGGPTGENLASGYPNATSSIEAWGHEREEYDFDKATFSKTTGHFTQLVWKSTTSLGCARTRCDSRSVDHGDAAPGWYLVCEYFPPGNVIGRFKENVQKRVKDGDGGEQEPSATTTTGGGDGARETGGAGGECPYPGQECSGAVGGREGGEGRTRWMVLGVALGVVGGAFVGL
ncbi:PR-1-like protein [Polyplosphaeria fusca]|uniref:PR-1-like protein n=1 Tax=Polyplosphaeria fusca TaxID=682080 RepID=A0A9P4UVW6_9PLEO|nr:PR-1-like protein [Polyplosphaeria fusca]